MSKVSLAKRALIFAACVVVALAATGCSEGANNDVRNATLVRTGGLCTQIALYGDYAYCAHPSGLNVYNISDRAKVVTAKEIPVVQSTLGFLAPTIKDKYLYAWNKPNFEVYDLSDPANPTLVYQEEKAPIRDIVISGTWLYAGCDDGLLFYDISNPIAPALKKTMSLGSTSIWLEGSRLYAESGRDGFRIYDVTNPAEPVLLGGWPGGAGEQSLEVAPLVVKGDYAWGANDRGVLSFNVANIAALKRIDSRPNLTRPVRGLAIHGNLLVASQTEEGKMATVEFLDISADPANPPKIHVWDGDKTTAMGYKNATIFNDFAEDDGFFYLAGPGGLVIWKKGN